MSGSSLSSVVSSLVRVSMGSAVPSTVTNEDLDRHIGEIILREAKQKAERYKKEGIRAYLPVSDANVPRTNKRFLSSIIRSTDDHNKAVLRTQAIAAAELKEERDQQERLERRARADEASQDRLRRLMSGGRRTVTEDRWRPDRERDRHRRDKRRDGDRDRSREGGTARRKSRSRSRERKRYWDEDEDEYRTRVQSSCRGHHDDTRSDRHHRRRRHRSYSRSRSPRRDIELSKRRPRSRSSTPRSDSAKRILRRQHARSRSSRKDNEEIQRNISPSPTHSTSLDDADSGGHRRRDRSHSSSCSPGQDEHVSIGTHSSTPIKTTRDRSGSRHHRSPPCSPSPHRSKSNGISRTDIRSKSLSPSMDATFSSSPSPSHILRSPSPQGISSKMDKYFSPTYDPRLDVAPLASSSGLTIDVPATGLVDNAQFEGWDTMLELIRIRREDRAEKKRLERLGLLPGKDKEGRGQKGKGMVSADAEEGKGIMGITYQKKGAVREWDMGKEGF